MKIKQNKIIRDSHNSVEYITSKLRREINFYIKILKNPLTDAVRQGKSAARKVKAIVRDGVKDVNGVYNDAITLYRDVKQD